MSENITTPEVKTNEPAVKTWAKTLEASEKARASAEKSGKRATALLWDGAVGAINEWDQTSDPDGNTLYDEVKTALGGDHRKGDASKIRTVALAVAAHNLDISVFPNLSKAYTAAADLNKGAPARKAEDEAAEKAVEAIEVPTKPSTPADAAKIVLAKGVDEAANLLVTALGRENGPAHRALVRALAAEVASVSKAIADEKKAAEAEAKAKDKAEAAEKIAANKAAKAEAKQAEPKAKPAKDKPAKAAPAKAEPVSAPAKAAPAKAAPAKAAPAKAAPAKAKPVRRAVPVRK